MTPDVLALFDLDNTLLQHDSDEQWVAFLIDKGELDRAAFQRASDDIAARYKRDEAGALEYTEFYLSTLRDRPLTQLASLHDAFMDERIRPVVPAATRELLARHQNLGHLCVLTAATSRFRSAAAVAGHASGGGQSRRRAGRARAPQGLAADRPRVTTPTLTAFAAPRGGASLPWDGPAADSTTPTLTAFAAPRGGASLPWDGPAADSTTPTLTAFAAPKGGASLPWDGPAGG